MRSPRRQRRGNAYHVRPADSALRADASLTQAERSCAPSREVQRRAGPRAFFSPAPHLAPLDERGVGVLSYQT